MLNKAKHMYRILSLNTLQLIVVIIKNNFILSYLWIIALNNNFMFQWEFE